MQRRDFLKSGVALAVAAELGTKKAQGIVPTHNWGKYDFGSGPTVTDRLNQGPFSQYPPDASIPTDDVVMTTTHCCPAKISGGHSNPLKISMITHGRSRN